jgi:hypothetical protein
MKNRFSMLMGGLVCIALVWGADPPAALAGNDSGTVSLSKDTSKQYRHRVRRIHHPSYYRRYHPTHWVSEIHYHPFPMFWPVYRPAVVVYPETVVVNGDGGGETAPMVSADSELQVPPTDVTAQAPPVEEEDSGGTSINVHFAGLSTADTQLSAETIAGANLLGLGVALRIGLDEYWAVEVGMDVLGGSDGDAQQSTVPADLSIMAHLFPGSFLDPYGIAGVDLIFSEYDDPAYTEVERYTQLGGHVGAGLELDLGGILVTSDLRLLGMGARPDRTTVASTTSALASDGSYQPTVHDDTGDVTTPETTGSTGASDGNADSFNMGFQVMLGVGWQF